MPTIHKYILFTLKEFLYASTVSGNAWEKVSKCSSHGKDGAQDYVGCNDYSSTDLFYGAKLWSLGPQCSMLGWTPISSREKQHLCRWVDNNTHHVKIKYWQKSCCKYCRLLVLYKKIKSIIALKHVSCVSSQTDNFNSLYSGLDANPDIIK